MARRPIRAAIGISAALHAALLSALLVLTHQSARFAPEHGVHPATATPPIEITRLVFTAPRLQTPSHGGGGGGGGNRHAEPIRRAEAPGHDDITLRTRRAAPTTGTLPAPDAIAPAVVLDARSLASGVIEQFGLPTGGVSSGVSQGPGSGGGVGSGVGTGIGDGRGPGVGPGSGGGIGGGVYRPGGSVTAPRLLQKVDPTYTSDALQRRVQGTVWLDVVVTAAGESANIRVSRSLDASLDDQAIKAVKLWRFAPGRLGTTAVNVEVVVAIDFLIR